MRVVLLAAVLGLLDAAQTFRSGALVVEVDVRVMKDGRFVTDLASTDFAIAEDGVPQKIQSVVLVNGDAASAPAPFASPASARSAAPHPSVWVFVFDTPHLTPGPLQRAREAVVTFISERFRQGDIGGIVVDGKMVNNQLTADREQLKQAAGGVRIPGDLRSRQLEMREWPRLQDEFEAHRIVNNDREALSNAVARACSDDPDACRRSPPDLQVRQKARQMVEGYRRASAQTLGVVDALSNGLARIPGAKTVVFLSEGFVIQGLDSQLRQAVGQAARAGAHFYSIDARGLNRGSGSQIIDQAIVDNPMGAPASFDVQADGSTSLAVDTGGFAVRNENNFGRALDEIQRDSGTYYVIGYTPATPALDGKYRAISVKVSRPGVKVRARRGYLALEPAALMRPGVAAPEPTPAPTGVKAGAPDISNASDRAVTLPTEALPSAPANRAVSVVPLDPGNAMVALGKEPASARVRPSGAGDTSSASNSPAELGWAAYERGDVQTAARHLTDAATAPDARPWVSYALGLSQFALRQYREASLSWERVRREVPEFERIYFSLADAYTLQKEDGAALKVLREAERRWPSDPEVANAIGVIHVRRASLDAAIESFARATAAAPSDALGFFNLARTLQMRLLKSQRYDPQMQKWIGGDEDRRRAVAGFQRYLEIGGPYERQAREALASLAWK